MASISEMAERLAVLQKRGKSTNQLRKMQDAGLLEYEYDLTDFLTELETIAEKTNQEMLNSLKIDAQLLKERLEAEKHRRSWRGKLGLSQTKSSEQNKAEKSKKTASQEELARFNEELEKIRAQRKARVAERYEPNQFPSESRSILTSAIDEFRHALIPPLLDSDITELQRKRDALDAAKAIQQVYKLDEKNVKGTLEKVKSVSTGAAAVLGEFAEETTGGVLKATSLLLAWPLILPVKILNQTFTGAKYAFCFIDGVFGFIDKGLDGIIGKLERTEAGKIKITPENIVKSIAHTILRGPVLAIRGLCQVAAIGCRWLQKNIDADKWLKSTPVTAGFAVGGVGAVVLIGLALASIPGLGIPIAVVAIAFAVATVGALLQGYFKAKAKAKELNTLELNPAEANQLEKYEYEHQHKPKIKEKQAAILEENESHKKEKSKVQHENEGTEQHLDASHQQANEVMREPGRKKHERTEKAKHHPRKASREDSLEPGSKHAKADHSHAKRHKPHKLHHFDSHRQKQAQGEGEENSLPHSHRHPPHSSKKRRRE